MRRDRQTDPPRIDSSSPRRSRTTDAGEGASFQTSFLPVLLRLAVTLDVVLHLPDDARHADGRNIDGLAIFDRFDLCLAVEHIEKAALVIGQAFAVILKERPDEPVGSIGVFPTEAPEIGSEPEIGYWIGRPFWGQGLIPEAVRELLRYCFEDKGAQRVWCSHYAGNEKSKRVIEKCGFSYQLTWESPALVDDALRPTLFYALTKEKWEKTR